MAVPSTITLNRNMPDTISEKIYYKMPFLLQNISFSLYGLLLKKRRYNRHFHEKLAFLMDSQMWSKDHIENYQNIEFIRVLHHAYRNVPFYKTLYDKHGIDVNSIKTLSDIGKLPIISKSIVKENQKELISNNCTKRNTLKGLTSGTTGSPLEVSFFKEGLAFQWAIWWRHKARFNLNLRHRHLTIGARVPVSQKQKLPPYWRHDFFNNRVYLSSYHISEKNLYSIVDFLNTTDFDFYTGYPSAIYALACLMETHSIKLTKVPRYIVTGSDALLPKYAETITRILSAPVTEQYGMAEFAGNLSKCEYDRFHLDFECCYLEGLPIEGNNSINLIFTGWGNYAMPFIRYEVGDFGKPYYGQCECGRESKCFATIDGRLEDYIITPDNRKIIGMNQVLEYAINAREIQIYQSNREKVEFRIVREDGFNEQDTTNLIREFERRVGDNMEISFRYMDRIPRTNSGKFKAVISVVDQ